jgi:hypothetical protein
MLFWIFVLMVVLGVVGIVVYNNTRVGEWCWGVSFAGLLAGIIAGAVSLCVIAINYCGVDGEIAANKARYESLVYQYKNNLYDNDNDLGKKELMNQIQEWNEELARYQENQDNLWIGIYIPNIYDQFDFINLENPGFVPIEDIN